MTREKLIDETIDQYMTQSRAMPQSEFVEWLRSRILLHEKAIIGAVMPEPREPKLYFQANYEDDHDECVAYNQCISTMQKKAEDYLNGV